MLKDISEDFVRDTLLSAQPIKTTRKRMLQVLATIAVVGAVFASIVVYNGKASPMNSDSLISLPSTDADGTTPGLLQIYSEYGFQGRSASYRGAQRVTLYRQSPLDDNVSSFRVGKGLRARLRRHLLDGGPDHYFEVMGPFSEGALGRAWDNQISSLDVFADSEPRVTVFSESDFSLGSAGTYAEGTYYEGAIRQNFYCSYCISALIVPYGLEVAIY